MYIFGIPVLKYKINKLSSRTYSALHKQHKSLVFSHKYPLWLGFPRAKCAFGNWCSSANIIDQVSLWAENLKYPLMFFSDLANRKQTWTSRNARLFQDFQGNFTPFPSCSIHPPTPNLNLPLETVFPRMEKHVYLKNILFKFIGCFQL